MNPLPKFLLLLCLAVPALHASPLRVLFFSKSSGYEHAVIKRENDQPSFAEKMLAQIGARNEFTFTFSKDGSLFGPEYLKQFDVVMFYTSGDLLSVGTDGNPAMTAGGKQALLDAIAGGKGFVGLHSCSDTFHTHESGGGNPPAEKRGGRFQDYGDAADPFVKMLGGEFLRHGPQQVAKARVVSPDFPGFDSVGDVIEVKEEWYSLKQFPRDLHVQLVLETAGMEGEDYVRPPYPIAWARPFGKGRVAYNAMGHREDVWESAAFQSMLVGVLKWAGGEVKADITPNLERVAPGHAAIQKWVPPEPKK